MFSCKNIHTYFKKLYFYMIILSSEDGFSVIQTHSSHGSPLSGSFSNPWCKRGNGKPVPLGDLPTEFSLRLR